MIFVPILQVEKLSFKEMEEVPPFTELVGDRSNI